MNPLQMLAAQGQRYWLDNLTRAALTSGELRTRVERDGLGGITSNPSTFHAAIKNGTEYESRIAALLERDATTSEIVDALMIADVRDACDVFLDLYRSTHGDDGYVSIELSPHLAHSVGESIQEARRLWRAIDRPNLLIKLPGTKAGLEAIEQLLFEGISVNITLLFSLERYAAVAEVHLRALERRAEAGHDLEAVTSVASFFLSRIDVLVDKLLGHRETQSGRESSEARALRGRVGIASAKLAYQHYKAITSSARWKALAQRGARPQRLLWASTGTKNPAYSDVMYIEPLIGPETITTMPEETIAAFADHGRVAPTLEQGVEESRDVLRRLAALDIDVAAVTEQLLNEGIEKFIASYDALVAEVDAGRARARDRGAVPALMRTALRLRRQVLQMTTAAGSGHPTSCLSCTEIVAALFFHVMRWDPSDPDARAVDRFVLSKGHAAPLLWAALSEAGAIREELSSLRRIDSTLEGHPTPRNPWIGVATGSLGQGLSAANGLALADRLDGIETLVYCLLGDGECSEGSVWEAAQFASLHSLKNLVAIVDANGLAQSGPAPYAEHATVYAKRFASFGWRVEEIDGHDLRAIIAAFERAKREGPTAIIAHTRKGNGVSFLQGAPGWHGKALSGSELAAALEELGNADAGAEVRPRRVATGWRKVAPPRAAGPAVQDTAVKPYQLGDRVATREAFGRALERLGAVDSRIVVLDGDVKNSTFTEYFAHAYPQRFFQAHIAEQNMVGVALGLAAAGKVPVAATFACFLSRAADFVRMAAHSRPKHLVLCGSHAGVSIGEDGPSQMGLEDVALFRSIIGSCVLHPCDAVGAERLTALAVTTPGIVYLRTLRPKTPVVYRAGEEFAIGGSKTLRSSDRDDVAIVAAGITVHEALAAHETLAARGIATRVIDAYSIKPLDVTALERAARETRLIVVVEDHVPEGGLGEAVAAAIGPLAPIRRLAVKGYPRSGKPEELLARHEIDRHAIEASVVDFLDRPNARQDRARARER